MDPLDLSAIKEDAELEAEGIPPYWAEIVLRLVAEAEQIQMAQEALQEAWAENGRLRAAIQEAGTARRSRSTRARVR